MLLIDFLNELGKFKQKKFFTLLKCQSKATQPMLLIEKTVVAKGKHTYLPT